MHCTWFLFHQHRCPSCELHRHTQLFELKKGRLCLQKASQRQKKCINVLNSIIEKIKATRCVSVSEHTENKIQPVLNSKIWTVFLAGESVWPVLCRKKLHLHSTETRQLGAKTWKEKQQIIRTFHALWLKRIICQESAENVLLYSLLRLWQILSFFHSLDHFFQIVWRDNLTLVDQSANSLRSIRIRPSFLIPVCEPKQVVVVNQREQFIKGKTQLTFWPLLATKQTLWWTLPCEGRSFERCALILDGQKRTCVSKTVALRVGTRVWKQRTFTSFLSTFYLDRDAELTHDKHRALLSPVSDHVASERLHRLLHLSLGGRVQTRGAHNERFVLCSETRTKGRGSLRLRISFTRREKNRLVQQNARHTCKITRVLQSRERRFHPNIYSLEFALGSAAELDFISGVHVFGRILKLFSSQSGAESGRIGHSQNWNLVWLRLKKNVFLVTGPLFCLHTGLQTDT